MSNGNGHRWSKFWWQDWMRDEGLRSCSFAAQGLWMRMLCIAHEAEPCGHVLINGKQPSLRKLAAMGNATEKEVGRLLAELQEEGVFSRTEDGTIYSRRMVRDAEASEAGREHIAKRWNTHPPNSPPIRGPDREPSREASRRPNGGANSPPTRNPITPEADSEAEAEAERVTHSLSFSSSPRTREADMPWLGKSGKSIPWRSPAIQLIYEQGMAAKATEMAEKSAADRARRTAKTEPIGNVLGRLTHVAN